MPGSLLGSNAFVLCEHVGKATPATTNPRVKVGGQPVVTQPTMYNVTNCTLPPPAGPCATAQWYTAATRVRAGGQPVLLDDSQAICMPTSTGLEVVLTQTRVKGI